MARTPIPKANISPLIDNAQVSYIYIAIFIFILVLYLILKSKTEKYTNEQGYIVLSGLGELEHRYLAIKLLGRNLKHTEVVHHINGQRADNRIENLCLMNREKHEFFHAWLRWKKEKTGYYPSIENQERILVEEYEGTLLKNISPPEASPSKDNTYKSTHAHLFERLREERKKIANEKNIPVYFIFDNRTLTEISIKMPISESELLRISGVGPKKLKLYGSSFLCIVQKFKSELDIDDEQENA